VSDSHECLRLSASYIFINLIDFFFFCYSGQVDLQDYKVLKLQWQERICTLDLHVQPVMQWE